MKHKLFILLLLICFSVNAMAGSIIILDACTTAPSMNEETTQQIPEKDQHEKKLNVLNKNNSSAGSANDCCDEHQNCSVNCSSAALILDTPSPPQPHRFTFESHYDLWCLPSNHSRLLRPPTLA